MPTCICSCQVKWKHAHCVISKSRACNHVYRAKRKQFALTPCKLYPLARLLLGSSHSSLMQSLPAAKEGGAQAGVLMVFSEIQLSWQILISIRVSRAVKRIILELPESAKVQLSLTLFIASWGEVGTTEENWAAESRQEAWSIISGLLLQPEQELIQQQLITGNFSAEFLAQDKHTTFSTFWLLCCVTLYNVTSAVLLLIPLQMQASTSPRIPPGPLVVYQPKLAICIP